MRKNRFFKSIRAVSPVIATIILVAISIVMAISIAYWALGIGNSFTKFEKVQYSSAPYATYDQINSQWKITTSIQNTGTATATVNNVFLNGQPYNTYTPAGVVNPAPVSGVIASLAPGKSATITVTLANQGGGAWVSGMSVQFDIVTAAGNSYPTTVTLP